MIMIDGDHFKDINDTYGHETGDKVLKKIAKTISNNFRSDDYICRLGGDEFVVFMVHADKGQAQTVETKISRINKQLSDTADGLPAISVSAGIVHSSSAPDTHTLMNYADTALYDAKKKGRSRYSFYEGIR